MPSLVTKDDDLRDCAPVVGFEILKLLKGQYVTGISIFELSREIKKINKASPRSLLYGLLFLYSLGLIEFNAPYVTLNV